jgi:hypothetical protein
MQPRQDNQRNNSFGRRERTGVNGQEGGLSPQWSRSCGSASAAFDHLVIGRPPESPLDPTLQVPLVAAAKKKKRLAADFFCTKKEAVHQQENGWP